MAKVSAFSALDMVRANLFLDFGKQLIASGDDVHIGVESGSFTIFPAGNKKGLADTTTFYGSFKPGKIPLPTGETVTGPASGVINDIAIWQFNYKTNKYTYEKLAVSDIKLDLSDVLKVIAKYNPSHPTDFKPVVKAAEALYAKIFKGADEVIGSTKGDTLRGFDNNDKLYSDDGNDVLYGGNGNDRLAGGKGRDNLMGGDPIVKPAKGGNGSDWAVYTDAEAQKTKGGTLTTKGVTVNLLDPTKNKGDWAAGDTYGSIENIQGSVHDDALTGSKARNIISGHGGDDKLTGGQGKDVFLFEYGAETKTKIMDFHAGDTIAFLDDAFSGVGAVKTKDADGLNAIKATAFFASVDGHAHDADDRILFNKTNGTLWYDADGNKTDSSAQLLAQIYTDGHHLLKTMTAANLQVAHMDLLA